MLRIKGPLLFVPPSVKGGGVVRTRLRYRSVSWSLGFLGKAASEGCHLLILGSQESTRSGRLVRNH